MATGIVSLAMDDQGYVAIARALFAINIGAYALVWIADCARIAHAPRALAYERFSPDGRPYADADLLDQHGSSGDHARGRASGRLEASAPDYAFVAGIEHFLAGLTLFFWATGSWWVSLLVAVFAWRHLHQRVPIHYDPQYWSLVFPLGMYSVATHAYGEASGLAFLDPLSRIAGDISLVAWLLAMLGLARRLLQWRTEMSAVR